MTIELTATQVGNKIKLVWVRQEPFWLNFTPEYTDETQAVIQTNTEIIPYDCTLYMDGNTSPSLMLWWGINGQSIYAYKSSTWEKRTADVKQGDELYIQAMHVATADFNGTISLYLDDASGEKVAEFDYLLKAAPCYLTTACVNYFGLADDGPELTAMRKLREYYAVECNDLIAEYYQLSPVIISKIASTRKDREIFTEIYESVKLCQKYVDAGQWKEAHDEYLAMYHKLKTRYGVK